MRASRKRVTLSPPEIGASMIIFQPAFVLGALLSAGYRGRRCQGRLRPDDTPGASHKREAHCCEFYLRFLGERAQQALRRDIGMMPLITISVRAWRHDALLVRPFARRRRDRLEPISCRAALAARAHDADFADAYGDKNIGAFGRCHFPTACGARAMPLYDGFR